MTTPKPRPSPRAPAFRRAAALLLLAGLAACDRPREAVLLTVSKTGSQETIASGKNDLLHTQVVWSDGLSEDVVTRDWASSAPTVARAEPCYDFPGRMCVFGYAAGVVTLTATYEGASASRTWTVIP